MDRIEYVKLGSLKFDPQNPRLPMRLRNSSEKKIIEWMLFDASLLDLVSSIGENGFFNGEPLLVSKFSNSFVVIEGNRRLAASKLLNNPYISKIKAKRLEEIVGSCPSQNIPKELPTIIFENRERVLDYLGYRHITGVKSWGPLAKARYLNDLYSNIEERLSLDEKCRKLASKIGSKGPHVKQLLISFLLYRDLEENGFFRISGLDEETIEFSHLYDSARYGGITSFLNIKMDKSDPLEEYDRENFKEYCRWLYDRREGQTRLGDSRNLKILNKVVQSKEALKAFRGGKTLEEASDYSDYPDELLSKYIGNAYRNMEQGVATFARVNSIKNKEVIKENLRSISKFSRMLHDSISSPDDL